jgi:hypothetical protein
VGKSEPRGGEGRSSKRFVSIVNDQKEISRISSPYQNAHNQQRKNHSEAATRKRLEGKDQCSSGKEKVHEKSSAARAIRSSSR